MIPAAGSCPNPLAPRVSVVTCFHNRREFVEASLRSVLNQTYNCYEVIAVDDASTDGTGEVMSSISDSRLVIIRNPANLGFVRSLIVAIEKTRGEFIAVHGAGDLSYPRRLESQVAFLDSHPALVAIGCHREVLTPDGMVVSRTKPGPELITQARLLRGNIFSHGEVMYRKRAYDECGGYRPQMRFAQDYDLWLRISQLGGLGVVQELLYGRVAHNDGVSFDPRKVVQQAAYSELARALAAGELGEEDVIFENLTMNGIDSVIPISNRAVVGKLRKRVHVLLSLGRWDAARELAFQWLEPGWANPVEVQLIRLACTIGSRLDTSGQHVRRLLARMKS